MENTPAVTKPDLGQLKHLAAQMLPLSLDLELITRLASVGITLEAWRESPVEDWHAEGRMTDAEMLRVNTLTTWEVLDMVRAWCADNGLNPEGTLDDLDDIDSDAFGDLAVDLLGGITDRTRVLANYESLLEFAGGDIHELTEHAESVFETMMSDCEEHGVAHPILWAALRGAGSKWWGTHHWPTRVETFIAALGDPAHRHWRGAAGYPQTMPPTASDRSRLEHLLLDKPWDLDNDTARWVIQHGLNYVVVGKS